MKKVGVIIGSLRKGSFNRKLAHALMKLSSQDLCFEIIEIGALPLFNQDDEENPPAAWVSFRDTIKNLDAFLFCTPEYNRSMPAALKNALDVGSRPYGKNLWGAKPCAVTSSSPGSTGGFGAHHHLRQTLVAVNSPCMPQPEVYLSFVDKVFDEQGDIANESTKTFLQSFMNAFERWIEANKAA